MWERVKSFLQGQQQLKQSAHTFFKKNGLLTLSVIAVVTGCTLGFMLRGTQLSTQVPHSRGWSRLDRAHVLLTELLEASAWALFFCLCSLLCVWKDGLL